MSEPVPIESLKIPSTTEQLVSVDTITERIAREMGFDDSGCSDLGICVTEAVNNAIIHAHKQRIELYVELQFAKTDDALLITVRDHGSGFDVDSIPDPTRPENIMKTGGRGVHVIRSLMDEVSFVRLADGMRMTMIKKLTR